MFILDGRFNGCTYDLRRLWVAFRVLRDLRACLVLFVGLGLLIALPQI